MEEKAPEVDLGKLTLQELLDHEVTYLLFISVSHLFYTTFIFQSWKARLKGYEDVKVAMEQATTVFIEYGNNFKVWASDSNVDALEKGLEALLVFVENASNAQRQAFSSGNNFD